MKRTPEQLVELGKNLKIQEINRNAAVAMNTIAADYSPWEAMLWSELYTEALEYKASNTIGPNMALELGAKYTTAANLADSIISNATALREARASIVKARQAKIKKLNALKKIDTVKAFDTGIGI